MSSEVDQKADLLARMTDILNEDAPNKWVWKTHASQDEWLRAKVLPALRDAQRALSASPSIGRVGVLEAARDDSLILMLRAWLTKRAGPDAGIDFEGGSLNWETLRRDRQSRTVFYGSDAEFVKEHFHGKGAAALLAALEATLVSHEEPAGDTQGAGTVGGEGQEPAKGVWSWEYLLGPNFAFHCGHTPPPEGQMVRNVKFIPADLAKVARDNGQNAGETVPAPMAWLVEHRITGSRDLRFEAMYDTPFNRQRWTWTPLYTHPAALVSPPDNGEAK